jgi:hypothetical protein
MYIIKSKGPRIDPWGTPCFTVPQFEKIPLDNFSKLKEKKVHDLHKNLCKDPSWEISLSTSASHKCKPFLQKLGRSYIRLTRNKYLEFMYLLNSFNITTHFYLMQ